MPQKFRIPVGQINCFPHPQWTSIRVACTIVRTDTGPSENFEVNVGLHQMSVLLLSCCESTFYILCT